jgi:hypothetical protein
MRFRLRLRAKQYHIRQSILMWLSSSQGHLPVGSSVSEHRPQNVDPAPRERHYRLVMLLAFGTFSLVVRSASRVVADRAVRRLVENLFQRPVAFFRTPLVREAARRPQHGRDARRRCEAVW